MYQEIAQVHGLVLILNPVFDYNGVDTGQGLSKKALHALSQWGRKPLVYLNDGFIALRKDGGNHVQNPVCKAGSTSIVISPENKLVLPCYHLGVEMYEIQGKLYELYQSSEVQAVIAQEGRLPACEGCVINCYMQPSFAVEINKYFWKALPSTLKYNWMKGTWRQLL